MKTFLGILSVIALIVFMVLAITSQEISNEGYLEIHNCAKEYPQLMPMIKIAMNDDYISYAERGKIIQEYNNLKKRKLLEIVK